MMKNITLIFLLFCSIATAQNVNIPDPIFKSALLADTAINTNMDAQIQLSEAQAFDGTIYATGLGIADFTGIETFTSMGAFLFNSNNATEIIFTDTMSLVSLYGNYNDLEKVSTTYCPDLINLSLRGNELDSLDLSNNKVMSYCLLLDNNFTQINLDSCVNLGFFDGGSNDFTSIDFSNNLALTYVKMVANNLTNIDVSFLTNLGRLNVTNNQLTSLDVTQNLGLYELYASTNPLGSIDVSQNLFLRDLYLLDCDLDEVNLINNHILEVLYLGRNNIEALNLSNNLDLYRVEMFENPIVELDLSAHNLLTRIHVDDCPLLQAVNIKNGNNINIANHSFTSCPALSCITVDDVAFANANFTNKDATTSYSADCGYCFISYNDVDTAICAGETYTGPNAVVYNTTGIYHDTIPNACGQDLIISIDLMVNATDAVQLPSEEFCTGDTLDFYGTSITTTGTSQITLSNTNGCDSIVSKTFTEISGVSITNNQGTLEATANMDSYQWYLDGDSIVNETNANYTPTADGDYSCEASLNTCSFLSNVFSFVLDTTGTAIQDLTFINLKVYPNPAYEVLNITLDEDMSSIKLFNSVGKLVKEFDPTSKQLDISSLYTGIYLLEITNKTKHAVTRIVKR